jgi:hypothetical protein
MSTARRMSMEGRGRQKLGTKTKATPRHSFFRFSAEQVCSRGGSPLGASARSPREPARKPHEPRTATNPCCSRVQIGRPRRSKSPGSHAHLSLVPHGPTPLPSSTPTRRRRYRLAYKRSRPCPASVNSGYHPVIHQQEAGRVTWPWPVGGRVRAAKDRIEGS